MKYLIVALTVGLAACAPTKPTVHNAGTASPHFQQVLNNVTPYQGETIRWGGAVAELRNYKDYAEVTMVQFPLTRFGKPISTEKSAGRFVVRSEQFLDPLVYEKGALVTFIGQVAPATQVKVDEKTLMLPVVQMSDSHTWPENYGERNRPYNPKHDDQFIGYGYYGTGSYSP